MNQTEIDIIRQCQAGNTEAFTELYSSYIDKIYRFTYYRTFHKETAEDLTSQTFFKALENIGGFSLSKGTFSAWLYSIARNSIIDHYRSQRNEQNINDIWDLPTTDNLEESTHIRQQLAKIKIAMKQLSSSQRELIILRLWDQLSHKEIAELSGQSEAASKMAFSRALAQLRQIAPLVFMLLLSFIHYYDPAQR